jgi:ligand-binding sensor domain-containing protein
MQKSKIWRSFDTVAAILLCLSISISCERTTYDLLDPADAGVWTLFDTSDGLPGNTVTDISLDSKGNLWLTFPGQGIARYSDGTWTYFRTSNSLLLNNTVSCVTEKADGSIIFGTVEGVSVLSGSNTWESYIDPVTTMVVRSIKVASNGNIWVGTAGHGFYVNTGSGFEKTTVASYLNLSVNAIEEDSKKNIWLGTDNGLLKWDGNSFHYFGITDGLPNLKVSSLFSDSKKRIWVGTHGGKTVSWFDDNGVHQLSLLISKDSCIINDIFEDRSGNVWFATGGDGLIRYDGIIPRILNIKNQFPEDTINSLGEDKYGNLWVGLATKGVLKYTLPIN